jgi:glycosyltransferase involved in cell wall biosynthesis
MRVLHLTLSFAPGGRRRAITTLVEHLRPLGCSADLGCLDQLGCAEGELADLFGSVTVLARRSVTDWKALRKLIAICDKQEVQIIHAHDASSQFTGALVRLWRPYLRVLMTFHRSLGHESARLRDRLRNAFATAQSGAVVTGSRERRQHYLHENYVPARKVVRIPFGIDTERYCPDPKAGMLLRHELGLPAHATVLGAVGHFGHEKGIDLVLQGFAALTRRPLPGPVALIVAGDGTPQQRAKIHALAQAIPRARVILAGFRLDIEKWFQAFDIFVHAPRLEAYGLVLAEASSTGVPVIATNVGGIPDLVREGCNGMLVPPEAPEFLADALERLILDDGLRQLLSMQARQLALAEFGAELQAQRHLRLYQDLVSGRPPVGVDEPCLLETVPSNGHLPLASAEASRPLEAH